MHLLLNRWTQQPQTLQVNRPHYVDDTEQHLCGLGLMVKIKGQIMYFLVNASSPKLLDIAISNFAGAKVI